MKSSYNSALKKQTKLNKWTNRPRCWLESLCHVPLGESDFTLTDEKEKEEKEKAQGSEPSKKLPSIWCVTFVLFPRFGETCAKAAGWTC